MIPVCKYLRLVYDFSNRTLYLKNFCVWCCESSPAFEKYFLQESLFLFTHAFRNAHFYGQLNLECEIQMARTARTLDLLPYWNARKTNFIVPLLNFWSRYLFTHPSYVPIMPFWRSFCDVNSCPHKIIFCTFFLAAAVFERSMH